MTETEDLAELATLDAAAILATLEARHRAKKPYTMCGSVCVSVNPQRSLPALYSDETRRLYASAAAEPRDAHPYRIASRAVRAVSGGGDSHTIVVTGESGAGKTEMSKICLGYAARCAADDASGARLRRILQAGCVLEFLGNAQTTRNDNSSRFGKFLQVQYARGAQVGARIETYLLERSRAVHARAGEGTFRVVYAALDEAARRHAALRSFDRNALGRASAGVPSSWGAFAEACEAVGFAADDFSEVVVDSVAAILLLRAGDPASASRALGAEADALGRALRQRRVQVHGETLWTNCEPSEEQHRANALAMNVYQHMFVHMRDELNKLVGGDASRTQLNILDIFGFENLSQNGLEQLCINYCNERIQALFANDAIATRCAELTREGVACPADDDVPKSAGLALCDDVLFPKLNEAQRLPTSTPDDLVASFVAQGAPDALVLPRVRTSTATFGVRHYAGTVEYTAERFIEHNRDELRSELREVLDASAHAWLAAGSRAATPREAGRAKRFAPSIAATFRSHMRQLMQQIDATTALYIRCIRPNTHGTPDPFDTVLVEGQVRANGLVQAAAIMRHGFAHQLTHSAFRARFRRSGSRARAAWASDPGFYWGRCTNVFMSANRHRDLLAAEAACALQRASRAWARRRRAARAAALVAFGAWRRAAAAERERARIAAAERERKAEREREAERESVAAKRETADAARTRDERAASATAEAAADELLRARQELATLKQRVVGLRDEIRQKDEWIFAARQCLARSSASLAPLVVPDARNIEPDHLG